MSSVVAGSATKPASARTSDLTPAAWLEAGQSLLRRGGLRALKLRPLAEELRVSTGSFYHHFREIARELPLIIVEVAEKIGRAHV